MSQQSTATPSVIASAARQSIPSSVIASAARQSMTALYPRWIATACGLAMTELGRMHGSGFNDLNGHAPVGVFEAHDVVFAQVGARLHFDHLELHPPRVFQSMGRAQWNIG